ncbi:MAG TPA: GrpB family protein [Ktedonobacteraceae bacterium]|nr:GrpB family protein [Ktedonobacteraceae bacterium]
MSDNNKTIPNDLQSDELLQAVRLEKIVPLNGPIYLADYDPEWPRLFVREAERIRDILGNKIVLLEHVGSTSIPGLAAKPRIDMLLVVADSSDEAAYVPMMETAGYKLNIREPEWHEHRLFKGPDTDINLHVFSPDCSETEQMLLFRDWLRNNPGELQLYEQTKRELAARDWKYVQHYADAKTAVVQEILKRARGEA